MARPKGMPKTGGRKKGTPNKTTARKISEESLFGDDFRSALKELAVARLTPLEVMHAVMFIKIGKGDYDGAALMAEKAAPFCHPKLNAAEVRVQHSLSARTDEELAASILVLREKLALVQRQQLSVSEQFLTPLINLQAGVETRDKTIRDQNHGEMAPT